MYRIYFSPQVTIRSGKGSACLQRKSDKQISYQRISFFFFIPIVWHSFADHLSFSGCMRMVEGSCLSNLRGFVGLGVLLHRSFSMTIFSWPSSMRDARHLRSRFSRLRSPLRNHLKHFRADHSLVISSLTTRWSFPRWPLADHFLAKRFDYIMSGFNSFTSFLKLLEYHASTVQITVTKT